MINKTQISQTNKQAGFTLIELLVVVAIIGILASVGIPMFADYQTTAKINSSKTNHSNMKTFIMGEVTKCGSGISMSLKNRSGGSYKHSCSSGIPAASTLASRFSEHFHGDQWKNPYVTTKGSTNEGSYRPKSGWGSLGNTNIYYSGNDILLYTNIGNESGGSYNLPMERIPTK